MTSFTSHSGKVYLDGVELSDHRVEDLLTLYEQEVASLRAAEAITRKAHCDLWNARCLASDHRQDITFRVRKTDGWVAVPGRAS